MKLHCLLVAIVLFCGQSIANQEVTPLLPEVKKILEVPAIDESTMDQNAYAHLMGYWAKTDDYLALGKERILYIDKYTREAVKTKDFYKITSFPESFFSREDELALKIEYEINGEFYQFPCIFLNNHNCVAQVSERKKELNELIAKNKIILERYKKIIKHPFYDNYYLTLSSPIIPIQHNMRLSWQRLIVAINAIGQGDVSNGLTIIQEEIDFYKVMLAGEGYLTDQMIAIACLLTIYNTTNVLLDSPNLRNELHNPQLIALFKPFSSKEQQGILKGMKKEANVMIQVFSLTEDIAQAKQVIAMLRETGKFETQHLISFEELEKIATEKKLPISYNQNKTMNQYYQYTNNLIGQIDLLLPQASTYYLNTKNMKAKELTVQEIYDKYGSDNLVGGYLIETATFTYHTYAHRYYDISNYLNLLTVKLQIKQAGVTKEQVPDFLIKLGSKAINPYSQKPFIWSEEEQTLSSQWFDLESDWKLDNQSFVKAKILFTQ